ncbi:MAG: glycerol-3-phosphate 1-O-acyltransferase PlsY [Armatimonadota bacterium]
MILVCLAILSYFVGAIPFGMLVARTRGIDIMKVGSGNIGATNVVRALGPKYGILVFVLDVLKGAVPGIVTHFVVDAPKYGVQIQTWQFIFGVVSILGHMFSPFLKFKGGKGVATGLGAALGSVPLTGLCAFAVMIVSTLVTRYISLSSLIAATSVIPISIWLTKDEPQTRPILVLMVIFIFYKHRSNISRLIAGTESRFTFRKQLDVVPETESVVEPSCDEHGMPEGESAPR